MTEPLIADKIVNWLLLLKDQASVYYNVPVDGIDANDDKMTCNQQVSMTVADAIDYQRKANAPLKAKLDPHYEQSEHDLLLDFMVINYADWSRNAIP